MLKYYTSLIFIFIFSSLFSQPNTEVYVMDLEFSETDFSITNFKNISNNEGYDSQPSFYNNETIFYARTNKEATDIAKHYLLKEFHV